MTAEPAGSLAASLATDAVTSADIVLSIASRSAASAPNPGSITRGASTKPAQNRTGSTSARSHDNQHVTPGGRAAAQSASSTLLPAPADPTTTVSRRPPPAVSRSCSTDLVTSVAGSVGGRNFVTANRALGEPPRPGGTLSATKRTPRSSRPAQAMAAAALTRLIVAAAQSLAIASSPGSPSDG